jgi:hypothetical protein
MGHSDKRWPVHSRLMRRNIDNTLDTVREYHYDKVVGP